MERAYVELTPEDAALVPPADIEYAKKALELFPGQWDQMQITPMIQDGEYVGMAVSVCHAGSWRTIIWFDPSGLVENDRKWLNHLVTGFNLAFFKPKQEVVK